MNLPLLLLVFAVAALAFVLWKSHKHQREIDWRKERREEPLIGPPIPDGGPAKNPDGSINWNSDEPLRGADLKAAMDEALAPYIATPDERSKYRCPHCGSDDWGSVPDIIFCGKGCGKGTCDPEYYQECLDAGYDGITWLSEWRNPDYPWPKPTPPAPPAPPSEIETTFSLIWDLFRRKAVDGG